MYIKKIQVSPGIFHGIPLESDRRSSTCRNGQITKGVRNGSIFLEVSRRFFAELVGFPKTFCLSVNRALFPCLHIASSKHEGGWENFPNPASVKMRLYKHGKVLCCFYKIILKNTRKSETS